MNQSVQLLATSMALFVGMLISLEVGYRVGRRATANAGNPHEGLGAIEAAIFALLGLLLGFAFAGAMSRLDARRQLIVRETNAMGTAYLRLDVVPPSEQPELRRLFRDYLEARLRAYERVDDVDNTEGFITQAATLQQQIWARAIAAGHVDQAQNTTRILLPALNDMFDVTTARAVAARTRVPTLVLMLLLVIALLSSLTAGYGMAERKRRSLLHVILYAAAVATTVYVVLDLDNPRIGVIRLDATDKILHDLHDSIKH